MPLFDFKCQSCGAIFEEIISHWEEDDLQQKFGKVILPCPKCEDGQAEKEQGIEITSNMNRTWADQTWGKATK